MWKTIPDFPIYSVSDFGLVRNDVTGRIMRSKVNQFGIPYVGLMKDGVQYQRSVPRLVALMFIPQDLDTFDTPISLNGDRFNCAVENLMWRPRWFAIQYHQQFKNPYQNHIGRPLRAIDDEEVFRNSFDVSVRYGLLERDVVLSILNKTYVWPTYQVFEIAWEFEE